MYHCCTLAGPPSFKSSVSTIQKSLGELSKATQHDILAPKKQVETLNVTPLNWILKTDFNFLLEGHSIKAYVLWKVYLELALHLDYLYGVSVTKDKYKLLCLNRSWSELPCLDGYSITYGCAQTLE